MHIPGISTTTDFETVTTLYPSGGMRINGSEPQFDSVIGIAYLLKENFSHVGEDLCPVVYDLYPEIVNIGDPDWPTYGMWTNGADSIVDCDFDPAAVQLNPDFQIGGGSANYNAAMGFRVIGINNEVLAERSVRIVVNSDSNAVNLGEVVDFGFPFAIPDDYVFDEATQILFNVITPNNVHFRNNSGYATFPVEVKVTVSKTYDPFNPCFQTYIFPHCYDSCEGPPPPAPMLLPTGGFIFPLPDDREPIEKDATLPPLNQQIRFANHTRSLPPVTLRK